MIRRGDKNSVNEFNNQLLIFVPHPPSLSIYHVTNKNKNLNPENSNLKTIEPEIEDHKTTNIDKHVNYSRLYEKNAEIH